MWLLLGIGAIVFALLNLFTTFQNKNAQWFRFLSLGFTSLTLCAFYSDGARRVSYEDWGGLMDIMPTTSNILWVCTIASILMNSISLFKDKN